MSHPTSSLREFANIAARPRLTSEAVTFIIPSAYNPADDLDGMTAALFAHLERRRSRGFNARKTPENGFAFPPEAPTLWIKFDIDASALTKEFEMQSYVHKHLPSQAGCRVPRVYRIHIGTTLRRAMRTPWALMVMDYVKVVRLFDPATNKQDRSFQVIVASRIATTLVAMSSLRPPYGTKPGPGDGDLMTCPVWGRDDFDAPKAFDTVDELEKYINEQAEDTPLVTTTADFSKEPLCLCYGDLNTSNFILEDPADPQSTLTVIDFEHTNWLPISFLLWEIYMRGNSDGPFFVHLAEAVKNILKVSPNLDNIYALDSLRLKGR